jgi:hypothetical protein
VRLVRADDAVDLWHGDHGGFGRLLVTRPGVIAGLVHQGGLRADT